MRRWCLTGAGVTNLEADTPAASSTTAASLMGGVCMEEGWASACVWKKHLTFDSRSFAYMKKHLGIDFLLRLVVTKCMDTHTLDTCWGARRGPVCEA